MASSIINWIIDKKLSSILSIDPNETKSGLWSGFVELNRIKIKPTIFQEYNLPFLELVNGYIGSIKVKMSLPRFYLYPIIVEIDKVYFHAKQKKLDNLNKKEETEAMEAYKKKQLLSQEELRNEMLNFKKEESSEGMVSQIINNLKIIVKDICIRYDDDISCPEIPFTFGALLKEITIATTNKDFDYDPNKNETIPIGDINYKILMLKNFGVYLDTYSNKADMRFTNKIVESKRTEITDELSNYLKDLENFYLYCASETDIHINDPKAHQYLLYNMSLTLKTAMNDKIKINKKPQIEAECVLENLKMGIGLEQIFTSLKLLAYINLNSLYRIGISKEYYDKTLTLDEQVKYIQIFQNYYQFKYVKKNESKTKELEKHLDDVHIKLTYDQIQSMREIAYNKMSNDKSIKDIDDQIKAIEKTTKGWFYNSELTEEQKHQIELLKQQKKEILEKGKQSESEKMQQIIEKTNTTAEIDQYKELADTDVIYKFKLSLPNCEIDVLEDKTVPMITLVNSGFNINAELRKKGQYFTMDLEDFKVIQKKLNDTPYQNLIDTKDIYEEGEQDIEQDEKTKAFSLEFENNPNLEKSNYRLKIRNTKSVFITLNLYCIQYLSNRVLSSLKSTIDLTNVSNYVVGDVKKYIKAGFENNLLTGNYQHFNVDLDIFIKSPIMIMPQNVCDSNNKNGLVLRFGDIKMFSILPERQDFTKYDYTKEENKEIMYDIYKLTGDKFYLGTLENFNGDISHINEAKIGKIIDEVTLDFEMENLIEAKNEKLTNLIMKIGINNVKINIQDQQLPFLVDLLSGMQKVNHILSNDLKHKKIEMLEVKPLDNDKEILSDLEKKKKADETRQKLLEEQSQQIDKNIKNIQVVKEVIQSDKIFFDFEFILSNVQMHILKTLSKSERLIISNSGNQKLKNEEFKEYLTFNMNAFKFGFKMTNSSNMFLHIDIISICMSDNELEFTEKYPKGSPLVNQEFKKLIYSIQKKKELIPIKEDEAVVDESQKPFIKIIYNYLSKDKSTEIIIEMQKLKISMNLESFKRLYQFYSYNMEYMSKSQALINKEIYQDLEKEQESENIKEEEPIIEDKKDDDDEEIDTSSKKKNVKKDLAVSLLKLRKQRSMNINAKKMTQLKKDENILEHELQLYETNSCKEENLIKEEGKSKTIIKFNFDEILMDMPIDEKSSTTKVLRFNYNLAVQIKMKNEYECYYSKNKRTLVKMNYFTKDMIINVSITNVDFTIKLFKDGFYIDTISKDNLLSKFRMKIDLNSFLIPKEEKNVMAIDIKLEPFLLIIGFREIKDFTNFWQHLSEFLTKMYEPYNDPISTLDEENTIIKKDINLNIIDTIDVAIDAVVTKKKLEQEAKILELKKQKQIIEKKIYNVSNFENQMDVTIVMDQFVFEFVDNTAQIIQPLLNLETSSMSVKYISNTYSGDTDNMANLIVESISGRLIPYEKYNVLNLYQYIDANFNTQIYFYNSKVNDFEPIMEPWQGQLRLNQVSKDSRIRCDFNSDSLLNLNFTVSSIKVFNEFMKKLSQSEEEWNTELRKESKFSVNGNDIAVVFDNQSGIDICYWFKSDREEVSKFLKNGEDKDSIIKHKIKVLKHGEKQSFTRENLREKYKKYKDREQLILYKDKFDFGIDQYNISHNNDFSFCHTQNIILKKGLDIFDKKYVIDSSNLNDSFDIDTKKVKNSNKKELLLDEEEIKTSRDDTVNTLLVKNNQKEFGLFEKDIQLSVEIKQDNLTKYVKFRSNILFYNNMDFDVDLYLVTEEDFKDIYNSNDANIKAEENDLGLLHLEKYAYRYIPLRYLKHNCRVYCSLICEQGQQKFALLYDNLSFLNKHLKEMKEYDIAMETSEDKSNIPEPNDIYSKIVPIINADNKNTYIAVDLMVQRGINDKVVKTVDKKEKELGQHLIPELNELTYRYEFVLDESLLIENQVPYPIKLNIEGEKELKQEINLNPLKYAQIIGVNLLEADESNFQLNLIYNEYSLFSDQKKLKDLFSIKNKNDIKEIILKNENNENGLICKAKINNNFIDPEIFNPTRFKLIKNFTKKKHIVLYFDYIIVNNSQTDLYIKDASLKDKNENEFLTNLSGKVFHQNVSLFSMNKEKIKVRTEKSTWSHSLSSNTIGIGGLVSLEEPYPGKDKEILFNDFSMSISSSSFFKNSTIIKFENRFLFYNRSGIDLYIKQYDPKDNKNNNKFESFEVKNNNEPYNLSILKISKVNNPHLVLQLDNAAHSSPFSINNVNDFNIKIPISDTNMLNELSAKKIENTDKSLYKFEHSNDKDYIILRATINTLNSGLLYIVVFNPIFDDYYIQNESDLTLKIKQKGEKDENEIILPPKTNTAFIWTNLINSERNIELKAELNNDKKDKGNPSFEIDFASISSKEIKLFKNYYSIQVLLQNKNHTRTLIIKKKGEEAKIKNAYLIFQRKNKVQKFQINLRMAGMGISIIDQEPKEVFYISFYGIDIQFNRFSFIKYNNPVVLQHIELLLKNFQIDYCLADSYPNIIVPKNQLVPSNEQQKIMESKGEDIVPFLHILVSQNSVYDEETKEYTYSYPQIDYTMQETIINIEQYCLLTLVNLYNEIMSGLDFYYNNEDKKKEEEDVLKKPWEYDVKLTPQLEDVQKVIDKSLGANNMYINYLFLGALKFTITLRIDLTQFETSMLFGFIFRIIGTLGNSLARISKSPIRFSEMYQVNVFKDTWGLISLITQHYTSQVIFQIYKILGSSDLLGNPIGFVDNIGTGFAEFFNEPRKGLVNGPLGFGQGLVKGFGGLVSHVVGGGLDVVAKISGSLLSAAKNIQGEKFFQKEEDEPSNVLSGIFDGIYGGVIDLGKGFTGLFTSPYKEAKKDGFGGFMKGLGKGFLGLIMAPVTCALRIGNSVVVGIKNTVTLLGGSKVKILGFRHPKLIEKTLPLPVYKGDAAEVRVLLNKMAPKYETQKIVYFKIFKYRQPPFDSEDSYFILTDKEIVIVYNYEELVLNFEIDKFERLEIHKEGLNEYIMLFFLAGDRRKYIKNYDFDLCGEVFSILNKDKNN